MARASICRSSFYVCIRRPPKCAATAPEYLRRMDAAGATRDPGIAHAFAQRPKAK